MLAQIERYVKTALVDKDAYVSSSALVSSMHLTHSSAEVVRRWVDEVQNALNGKTQMVQYHALGVLHKIRQHDRLAVLKTITTLAKGTYETTSDTCQMLTRTAQAAPFAPLTRTAC